MSPSSDRTTKRSSGRLPLNYAVVITIGVCGFAGLALLLLGYYFFVHKATPPVTILPSSPQRLLTPNEFAQSGQNLAQAVTDLNNSELRFLQDAQAGASINGPFSSSPELAAQGVFKILLASTDQLRSDLQEIAARATSVSLLASNLANTAASQNGGSDAALQLAGQYSGISRLGAALVIEAQNAQEGLGIGAVTRKQAALTVAQYGARLWTPTALGPSSSGNPFTPFLAGSTVVPQANFIPANQSQLDGNPELWMAASPDIVSVNLAVPASLAPVPGFLQEDFLTSMTTSQGQADANAARQLASAIINAGGNTNILEPQPNGGQVVAAFPSAVALSSSAKGTPSFLPAYPNGTANSLTHSQQTGDILSTLIGLSPDNTPTVQSQTPIMQTAPAVALTISNITVSQVTQPPKGSGTFEGEVVYEFDVQWQTSLSHPQLVLDCAGGNHFTITSASGTQHVTAKGLLILYPGSTDAYCYANSPNGAELGSTSTHFLVGDAAGATQRAQQVETDSVALDFTLTADALGTTAAELNHAVETQAVIGTANAVSTEVSGTQNAEFLLTVTAIARRTELAVPVPTEIPSATPTFVPVLIDTLFMSGDLPAINTSMVLQRGRLYRICLSGTVNLTTGPVEAYQIMHVNGISVPVSGCMAIEGNGAVAAITCGQGTAAQDPGGYTINVYDLGPY